MGQIGSRVDSGQWRMEGRGWTVEGGGWRACLLVAERMPMELLRRLQLAERISRRLAHLDVRVIERRHEASHLK